MPGFENDRLSYENSETLFKLISGLDPQIPVDIWLEVGSRVRGLPQGAEQIEKLCGGFSVQTKESPNSQPRISTQEFYRFFTSFPWESGFIKGCFSKQYGSCMNKVAVERSDLEKYFEDRDKYFFGAVCELNSMRQPGQGKVSIKFCDPPEESFFAACAEDIRARDAYNEFLAGGPSLLTYTWQQANFCKIKDHARDAKLVEAISTELLQPEPKFHIILRGANHGPILRQMCEDRGIEHDIADVDHSADIELDPMSKLARLHTPELNTMVGMRLVIAGILLTELSIRLHKVANDSQEFRKKLKVLVSTVNHLSLLELLGWNDKIASKPWGAFFDRRFDTLEFLSSTSIPQALLDECRMVIQSIPLR